MRTCALTCPERKFFGTFATWSTVTTCCHALAFLCKKQTYRGHALDPEVRRNKGRAVGMIMVWSQQRLAPQRNPKGEPLSMPTEKVHAIAGKPAQTDKQNCIAKEMILVFSCMQNSSAKKLTGSQNHLFSSVDLILPYEHFFMMTILTLDLTPVLVEILFLACHNCH